MRLREIYRFELAYQVRRIWPWLFAAVLVVVAYLMARDNSLADAMYEDFYVNSPFAIAKSTVVGTLLWLMVAAAIAGEAGARDVATGLYPLVYTTPVHKGEYLAGRFLAALTINAVLLLVVQIGILLGIYAPPLAGANIGPFRPSAYVTSYLYLSLPNAVFATALQFGLATRTGRPMASYLGSFVLFFMGFFVATIIRFVVRPTLGMVLDPIGVNYVLDGLAHDWTVVEKKTRLIGLEGTVLYNRVFWLAIGLCALAFTFARFQFAHRVVRGWWFRRRAAVQPTAEETDRPARRVMTRGQPQVGAAFALRQTLAIAGGSFRVLASSYAGLAFLVFIPLLMVPVVLQQMSSLGSPLEPTTALVLREMTAPLNAVGGRWVIVPPLIVFFAGELVWRERDAGLGDITDAMPGSEWPLFTGKLIGLSLVLVVLMAMLTVAGVIAQTIAGYHAYEIGLYVKTLFGLQLPEYLLFAVLALAIHVMVNQKYLGHLVGMMAYVFIALLAGVLGIEHNMLIYGSGPGWTYTPMRGFGAFIAPWLWFKSYWAAWALLLAVAARLLWVRGREKRIGVRMREARARFGGATAGVAIAAGLLIAALGGFVFYNTNIINEFASSSTLKQRRAEYEQRYGRFEAIPQPRMLGASLRVDIQPRQRSVGLRGTYTLVNHSSVRIDSVGVTTAVRSANTRSIAFDRPSTLAVDDREHGYRIYRLERPLEPGDTTRMTFDVEVAPRGFANGGVDPSLARQASFFTNATWFPSIGFQPSRVLLSAADRRAYGLAPRPLLGALYDESQDASTRGEGIAFDAVMSTDSGQVAVAPGDLRRTWSEGARRYFEYQTSAPIGDEWSFFSAPYAVREEKWNGVTIRLFHNPKHTAYLDRALKSVRASLEYYSSQFGPYRYTHLSVLERPGAPGSSAHAEASIIYHGESYPVWTPRSEPKALDMPYAVMTHEMGHEWPHPYALVEGLPFLGEGLAWYFGMQAVEASRGEEQLHRLLTFMRGPYPYPIIRRGEPLLRALDPYMAYRKGPMAMYALRQYVGTDSVNGAVRRFFDTHAAPGAPLATTLDLYRELQAVTPDSLKPMLHDFFEVNAFWQLATEGASAVESAPGTWRVTLDVNARKLVYDTAGVVTELPMDQWVPVGVFAEAEKGHEELSSPMHLELHRIRTGKQRIVIEVRGRKPVLAGIDPRHLLDWEEREDDDNVKAVIVQAGAGERKK